jgi:hypothetical protein
LASHNKEPFRRITQRSLPARRLGRAGLFTLTVCAAAALVACGGGGGNNVPPTMLSGTVALGAAVPGAQVTISDADGATPDITGTADGNGAYALDV